MRAAQMKQQLIPKAGESVWMGQHDACHFPRQDRIHQSQKQLPLEVKTAANLGDPFIHLDGLLFTKRSQDCLLVRQLWLLRLTGHSAIGDRTPILLHAGEPKREPQILIGVVASVGNTPMRSHF